jgi:lipopolysaccharide biosynthesis glycosyltransferase
MNEIIKSVNAILFILDSNLRFQSIALLLNILETKPNDVKVLIFYVYDNEKDRLDYQELINKCLTTFKFENKSSYLEVKFISSKEADELTKTFEIRVSSPITRTAFLRLFLMRWIPTNVDKIVYLDIDILIVSSFEELFALDFTTPICAELNVPASLGRGSHLYGHNSPYFNSGVLLINVNKWKSMNLEDKFLAIGATQSYPFLDQDILNIVFKNNWTRFGRGFNYLHFYGLDEKDTCYSTNPSIIHFAGSKPWSQTPITQYVTAYRHNFNRVRRLHGSLADE